MDKVAETGKLIAPEKVQGAQVYSPGGDDLGSIDDIMIDEKSGIIAYAIMSFGGFLASIILSRGRC